MKINAHVLVANLVGFALVATAYLLERSSCLSLPGWLNPVLLTVQIGLNALAPAVLSKPSS